mgnify:CR=1 FL=1
MQQMRRHILYMSNKYTLGIDIGSTTVKIAILDENDTLLFADYQRHFANIQETLAELLAKAYGKLGELTLHPVITGSGGLTLANHLGVPFVQEVIAVIHFSSEELRPRLMLPSSLAVRMPRSFISKTET